MSKVVFDIETIGYDFDKDLDDTQREYLLKFAKTEDEIAAVKEGLGLYPLSGKIVTIAMYNCDSGKGVVYYDPGAGVEKPTDLDEEGAKYIACDEKEILEKFWETIKKFEIYITFNGRSFDIPFIRIRSAILGIPCSIELMTPKFKSGYKLNPHIDLLEELTFQGATKKFNLDFYTRAFGIKSPKESVNGHEVPNMIKEGRGLDVAKYCYGDVVATAELFDKWNKSFRMQGC
jgi:DNA polymerase elongation subunit (family B)